MDHAIAEKPYKGRGMEGATARWYASLTRNSLDRFRTLARRVAAEIPEGARVLEVAPGPGYFAIELAKLGRYAIVGLDISRTLVVIASQNAAQAGVAVDFRVGDAPTCLLRIDRSISCFAPRLSRISLDPWKRCVRCTAF
jgi:ubiquinone/menaquinone biosynthesis C-methylase UbiE